jgi:hypothetical protein
MNTELYEDTDDFIIFSELPTPIKSDNDITLSYNNDYDLDAIKPPANSNQVK